MKQVRTTIILSAFAAVSLISALTVYYFAPNENDGQNELIGEVFYPEFTDPVQAASLKLIVWDGENKKTREFDVHKIKQTRTIDGEEKEVELWALPDHENYPVESPERLRETAGSVMNIERLSLASNSKEEHERLGVFDPSDEKEAKLKEANQIGDRIILKDDSGNTICDLIIGNAVDAEAENEITNENRQLVKGERYYVRQPDQNETYIARLDLQITTDFSKWIDDDLLQVGDANVSKIQFMNYEVESKLIEKFGGRVPVRKNFEEFVVQKNGFNWSIDDLKFDSEEIDSAPLNALESQLKSLSILEVQPKPTYQDSDMKILNADLSINAPPGMSKNDQIRIQQQVLGPQGFIIGLEDEKKVVPTLLSTNGELKVATDDGLVYHLVFGYDVNLEGDDFEFAANKDEAKDSDAKDQKGDETKSESGDPEKDSNSPDKSGNDKKNVKKGKIMSVYVKFDPNLIERPEKPIKPVPPAKPDLSVPVPTKQDPNKDPSGKDSPEKDDKKTEPKKDAPKDDNDQGKKAGEDAGKKPANEPSKSEPPAKESAKTNPKKTEPPKSESTPKQTDKSKSKEPEKARASDDSVDGDEKNQFSPVAFINVQEKETPKKEETKKQDAKKEKSKIEKSEKPDPAKQETSQPKKQEKDAAQEKSKSESKQKTKVVPPGPDLEPQEQTKKAGNKQETKPANQETKPPQKSPEEIFAEKMQAYNEARRRYESELQQYEEQMKDYEQQVKDYEKKIEDNRKMVAELNSRFADWFYIVDAADLEKVKLSRATVVKPKAKPDPNKPPAGLPPNFNFPGGIPNLKNLPGRK